MANGLGEPGVGVREHQPDAIEARLPGVIEVRAGFPPGGLGFAAAHLAGKQLPAAVPIAPHGDDDGLGADLMSLAQPALEVGGIEVDAGVAAALQRMAQAGFTCLPINWRMGLS